VALFWLPGALQDHTPRSSPKVKRTSIGRRIENRSNGLSGWRLPPYARVGLSPGKNSWARLSSEPMVGAAGPMTPSQPAPVRRSDCADKTDCLFQATNPPISAGGLYSLRRVKAKRAITDPALQHMPGERNPVILRKLRLLDVLGVCLTRPAGRGMRKHTDGRTASPEPPVEVDLARRFEKAAASQLASLCAGARASQPPGERS